MFVASVQREKQQDKRGQVKQPKLNRQDDSSKLTAAETLKQQWEDICNRCGLCCYEKIRNQSGRVVSTPVPCRYLDLHSHECKVYDKRFNVGENCQQLTPETVATVEWLPEECAYRQQQSPLPPVKKQTEQFQKKRAFKRRKSAYYQDDNMDK